MSYSFVLVEQSDKTGEPVTTLLQKRFASARLERISGDFFHDKDKIDHDIDWASQDIVLLDCSVSLSSGVEQLQRIKWQTPKPSVLLFSDQAEIERVALQNGADGFFYFKGCWAGLGANIENLINLRNHLVKFPFRLNDWCLLEVLHNTDNSAVYKAVHRDGKLAAIKRYKYKLNQLSDSFIEKFLFDLERFSQLKTPRLVRIYDSGISDNILYQVMELMTRGSLQEHLTTYQPLPLPRALTWFYQIVYALQIVHDVGLLHRDLKTANIMLRDDDTLALNDYGTTASLLVEADFMTEEDIHCSPYYVSPERSLDEPSGVVSDIYSLGIIFYELLMGKKPYEGSSELELMIQHVIAPIPVFPDEYANYQLALNKMLAKDETLRLQRVIDVGSYLGG